ncbi:hypothetical protein BGZ68_003871 [Mortierella alpina]|nr:hypothetical protein BGZ68_003871 [Mortierella alpina]
MRLLLILAIVQTALAVYYTNDRPSFGEFNNASLYSLPADGNILVPDRSGFDQHVANVTAVARKNGVARAAAQSDIMNICVGIAANPTRTRLFKDRASCDIQGWTTLYTFQAFRKYDKFMAPTQMCTGLAGSPERSMMFPSSDCNTAGWTHDFTFFYNQCPHFKGSCDGNVYHRNMQVHVYEAFNPHRIMLAPGYDGTKHGWTYKWSLAYMAHYFAMSSKGYKLLETRYKPHLVKRANITPPSKSELEAFRALIDCWTMDIVGKSAIQPFYEFEDCLPLRNLVGYNDKKRRSARIDNQNPHTVVNAYGQQSLNIQLQMGGNTYGNLLIPVDVELGAAAIRAALLNCLETQVVESMEGAPDESHVQVPSEPGHIELPNMNSLVRLLGGTIMFIGSIALD